MTRIKSHTAPPVSQRLAKGRARAKRKKAAASKLDKRCIRYSVSAGSKSRAAISTGFRSTGSKVRTSEDVEVKDHQFGDRRSIDGGDDDRTKTWRRGTVRSMKTSYWKKWMGAGASFTLAGGGVMAVVATQIGLTVASGGLYPFIAAGVVAVGSAGLATYAGIKNRIEAGRQHFRDKWLKQHSLSLAPDQHDRLIKVSADQWNEVLDFRVKRGPRKGFTDARREMLTGYVMEALKRNSGVIWVGKLKDAVRAVNQAVRDPNFNFDDNPAIQSLRKLADDNSQRSAVKKDQGPSAPNALGSLKSTVMKQAVATSKSLLQIPKHASDASSPFAHMAKDLDDLMDALDKEDSPATKVEKAGHSIRTQLNNINPLKLPDRASRRAFSEYSKLMHYIDAYVMRAGRPPSRR